MIKPGSVCYLVNLPPHSSAYNGRLVTIVSWDSWWREWIFAAPWLVAVTHLEPQAASRNLLPINDPDEPVTTHTPEALTA